jgi:ubiquinone/menaquinone biosynthesis C-methylase UbiE
MNKLVRWLRRVSHRANKPSISEDKHINDYILANPHLPAKFYPYQPDQHSYLLKVACEDQKDEFGLPIPPKEIRYHSDTIEEYLSTGKGLVDKMMGILEASGSFLKQGDRVLDFGCADGYLVRWFHDYAKAAEVWGVDINATQVIWCQQNLSPPFRFATTTSFPHLPFPDGFFDFIYAGSVFTHIADLAETWLMELKRVVCPGGKLYLTVHDNHTIDYITKYKDDPGLKDIFQQLRCFDSQVHFSSSGFAMFTMHRTPGEGSCGQAQVFYDIDYLRRHWGNYLKIISITPEAYGYQTAVLLEK